MILLVRHASAGDRDSWDGPDEARPLDGKGERQAQGLPALLAGYGIERIESSPAVRCRATVEPLAHERGLTIETADRWREGRGATAADELLAIEGDVVVCTHGDVTDEALDGLRRAGWPIPEDARSPKGSTWVLDPVNQTATYLPRPG
jgi:phosphohistidine phosphatase SixA